MIDKDRIKKEAYAFFEWPTDDKQSVSTVSMLIFCNAIGEMIRAEEREACALICDGLHDDWHWGEVNPISGPSECAVDIRKRSNVKLSGCVNDQ